MLFSKSADHYDVSVVVFVSEYPWESGANNSRLGFRQTGSSCITRGTTAKHRPKNPRLGRRRRHRLDRGVEPAAINFPLNPRENLRNPKNCRVATPNQPWRSGNLRKATLATVHLKMKVSHPDNHPTGCVYGQAPFASVTDFTDF